MLISALLLTLASAPVIEPAFLLDPAARKIRLIALEDPTEYEGWSRPKLRDEYDRIENERPSIAPPVVMMVGGTTAGLIATAYLVSELSQFFGTSVAVVAGLSVIMIVGFGVAIIGTILLVRMYSEWRSMGHQLDRIEAAYKQTFYNQQPGLQQQPQYRPCPEPIGPPPVVLPPPDYHPSPSSMNVEPLPVTVAVF
jgi:hypothetical protein